MEYDARRLVDESADINAGGPPRCRPREDHHIAIDGTGGAASHHGDAADSPVGSSCAAAHPIPARQRPAASALVHTLPLAAQTALSDDSGTSSPAPTSRSPSPVAVLDAAAAAAAADSAGSCNPRPGDRIRCPCCTTSYATGTSGPSSFAAHLAREHRGIKLTASQADSLRHWVRRCDGCGSPKATRKACTCGARGQGTAFQGDDIVAATGAAAAAAVARDRRALARAAAASAAVAAARVDINLPAVDTLISSLAVDALTPIAESVDHWAGGETIVHIPVRSRAAIAEIFAGLLHAMVGGNAAAGILLRCLPKLLLHGAALRRLPIRGLTSSLRERCSLLLSGQVRVLFERTQRERAAAAAAAAAHPRPSAGPAAMAGVRRLAIAGAFSKAVNRLTSSIASYEASDALRWARALIPNPPHDHVGLGAKPVAAPEKEHLAATRTCASDIAPPANSVPPIDVESDDDDDEHADRDHRDIDDDRQPGDPAPTEQQRTSPTAFASGVHFAALSAPGPSGLRAEHLRAFATCRSAKSRQAYHAAMREFVATAIRGDLPANACWWLTDSSLTYLRKPGASDDAPPRPLRVGETLRRFVAKRIASAEKAHIQRTFAKRRQFGVACPGGAEILAHYRLLTREFSAIHSNPAVGEWDLDFRNCYGSILWPAIDESVRNHVPGALPWTRWCHSDRVRVVLPGGGVHLVERGAEQGDPLGPVYAAAVIADVCQRASAIALDMRSSLVSGGHPVTSEKILECVSAMRIGIGNGAPPALQNDFKAFNAALGQRASAPDLTPRFASWDSSVTALAPAPTDHTTPLRCLDVWYLDDSFVRASALDGDLWLAAIDAVGALAGLERSMTKSFYRAAPTGGLVPPYSAVSCDVQLWAQPVKFLGVCLDDPQTQLASKSRDLSAIHKRLRDLDDPAIELVLIRQCAEVNRVTHLLRAIGPTLPTLAADAADPPTSGDDRRLSPGFTNDSLRGLDLIMRDAIASVTRSELTDEAAEQASWGVKAGGLGLRPATAIVLPAHVASMVESQPFVDWLCSQSTAAGVPCSDEHISHAGRRDRAVHSLAPDTHSDLSNALLGEVVKATKKAKALADSILGSSHAPQSRAPASPPSYTLGSPPAIVPDVGEHDPENARAKMLPGAVLQHALLGHIDSQRIKGALAALSADCPHRSQRSVVRHRRLLDLASSNTDHTWLWAINPAHGYVLSSESFVTALRLRLGLPVASYTRAASCAECGVMFTADAIGDHALLCAKGMRVVGHNHLRDHVAALARVSDSTTQTEVSPAFATDGGGAPASSSHRRPADILTSAAPLGGGVGRVALDVGIACPFNSDGMRLPTVDVLSEYRERKIADNTQSCAEAGWRYMPLVISTFGRAHDVTKNLIHRLAVAAGKAFGGADVTRTETTWWRNATTLLMERNARMVSRCLPRLSLPPIISGVDESRWGHAVPPRATRRAQVRAEALVAGGDGPRPPHGD